MGRHDRYNTPVLFYHPVRMTKFSLVLREGQTEDVGTYDLGRRFRVLHEGEYPPFKERFATFLCARTRGGKLVWGERVPD